MVKIIDEAKEKRDYNLRKSKFEELVKEKFSQYLFSKKGNSDFYPEDLSDFFISHGKKELSSRILDFCYKDKTIRLYEERYFNQTLEIAKAYEDEFCNEAIVRLKYG